MEYYYGLLLASIVYVVQKQVFYHRCLQNRLDTLQAKIEELQPKPQVVELYDDPDFMRIFERFLEDQKTS